MLPVSLGCPFSISPSVFSNVYLYLLKYAKIKYYYHNIKWPLFNTLYEMMTKTRKFDQQTLLYDQLYGVVVAVIVW